MRIFQRQNPRRGSITTMKYQQQKTRQPFKTLRKKASRCWNCTHIARSKTCARPCSHAKCPTNIMLFCVVAVRALDWLTDWAWLPVCVCILLLRRRYACYAMRVCNRRDCRRCTSVGTRCMSVDRCRADSHHKTTAETTWWTVNCMYTGRRMTCMNA